MMLAGKVVAITGAGRGIGRAIALLCAREGAAIVVNDPGVTIDGTGGQTGPAAGVVAEILGAGGLAVANFASVADPAGARSIIDDALAAFGRIDAVVNNAGILRDAIWHRLSHDDWRAVIDVHLNGAFNVAKAATPCFREQQSGSFVHLTSGAGLIGNVGQANYAAAKLGIVGLSQSIALDMARYGVRSNCIAPTAFTRMIGGPDAGSATDAGTEAGGAEAGGTEAGNAQAGGVLQALGAERIAPLAAYLVSDAAAGVSNQIFGVRGNEICVFSRPRPQRPLARPEGWTPRTIADELIPALAGDFAPADETAHDVWGGDPL